MEPSKKPVSGPAVRRFAAIRRLLDSAARVLGLRITFHDSNSKSGLPWDMQYHVSDACLAIRKHDPGADARCVAFCFRSTHRDLAGLPAGRVQTCPHGLTELAVPVFCDARMMGVLFAGPCRIGTCKRKPPVLLVPSRQWLADRLLVLAGVASRLALLLAPEESYRPVDRRTRIEVFIRDRIDGDLSLGALAAELGLSESRTSHAVTRLFGRTFSALVQEARARSAAEMLVTGSLPIATVAALCGFADANYFSRVFRAQFGCPPRAYRERHRIDRA